MIYNCCLICVINSNIVFISDQMPKKKNLNAVYVMNYLPKTICAKVSKRKLREELCLKIIKQKFWTIFTLIRNYFFSQTFLSFVLLLLLRSFFLLFVCSIIKCKYFSDETMIWNHFESDVYWNSVIVLSNNLNANHIFLAKRWLWVTQPYDQRIGIGNMVGLSYTI